LLQKSSNPLYIQEDAGLSVVAKPSGNLRRHPVPPLELREVNLEDLEVCIVQHGCHFELVCWIDERILLCPRVVIQVYV